ERFRDRLGYAVHLLHPTAADLAVGQLPSGWGFLYWGLRWFRLAGLLNAAERPKQAAVQGEVQ
ncbi:hypothetical protein MYX77_11290, partial [Acidobacteriia bacterium AH_259_A11_L15]|nr:hypothetical protein [Acidobacteriia bacterium AH_259_A11_L15]